MVPRLPADNHVFCAGSEGFPGVLAHLGRHQERQLGDQRGVQVWSVRWPTEVRLLSYFPGIVRVQGSVLYLLFMEIRFRFKTDVSVSLIQVIGMWEGREISDSITVKSDY